MKLILDCIRIVFKTCFFYPDVLLYALFYYMIEIWLKYAKQNEGVLMTKQLLSNTCTSYPILTDQPYIIDDNLCVRMSIGNMEKCVDVIVRRYTLQDFYPDNNPLTFSASYMMNGGRQRPMSVFCLWEISPKV